MDLSYTDEQEFLREAVRGSIEREAPLARVREQVLGERVDRAPFATLFERQGWTGIGIPEAAGGEGGDLLEAAILAEELGRGAVPADALYATLLAGRALAAAGHEVIAGAALACAGDRPLDARGARASEPAGPVDGPRADASEPAGPVDGSRADASEPANPVDGPRADACGRAIPFVLGAPDATAFVAWTANALTVHEAARVTERRLVDRTRALGDVTLGPALERVDGTVPMREIAAWGAVLIAADALGAAQRMLELTVEYVAQRVQFKVPVGSFQAVKHAAAEMLVGIEGTRAVVQHAAWSVGAGEPGAATDAWVAKARAARTATHVADKALFLHGAVGYTWEHDLQLLFKRAKSDAQLLGGAAVYDERIADALALVPGHDRTTVKPEATTVPSDARLAVSS